MMHESNRLLRLGVVIIALTVAATAIIQFGLLIIYHESLAESCQWSTAMLQDDCLNGDDQWRVRWPEDYAVTIAIGGGIGFMLMFVGFISMAEPPQAMEDVAHTTTTLHDHIGADYGFIMSEEHHN